MDKLKLIIIGKQSFYVHTEMKMVGPCGGSTVSLDSFIEDLELQLKKLQKIRFEISLKDGDVKRQARKFAEAKEKEWWNKNEKTVFKFLTAGHIVKFKGTKDGLGLREIIGKDENRNEITGFKFKPGYRKLVRSTESLKGWVNIQPEKTLETTTNGVRKITHIKMDGSMIPIKEFFNKYGD